MFKKFIPIVVILFLTVSIVKGESLSIISEMSTPSNSKVIIGMTDDVNKHPMILRTDTNGYLKTTLGAAISSTTSSIQAMQYRYDGSAWNPVLAYKLFSTGSITGNGIGAVQNVLTSPMQNWSMIIDRTAGTTNVVEIDLLCSTDGVDTYQIATITDLTTEPAGVSAVNIPCAYFTYNVVTVGTGNTLQIHVLGTK